MIIPSAAFEKWIGQPTAFFKSKASQTSNPGLPFFKLIFEDKMTDTVRSSTSGAAKAIQEVLKKATVQDQYERDVPCGMGTATVLHKVLRFV